MDHSGPVQADLCALACAVDPVAPLDLCLVQSLPGTPKRNATNVFPMNWRFFPTLDPQESEEFYSCLWSKRVPRNLLMKLLHCKETHKGMSGKFVLKFDILKLESHEFLYCRARKWIFMLWIVD